MNERFGRIGWVAITGIALMIRGTPVSAEDLAAPTYRGGIVRAFAYGPIHGSFAYTNAPGNPGAHELAGFANETFAEGTVTAPTPFVIQPGFANLYKKTYSTKRSLHSLAKCHTSGNALASSEFVMESLPIENGTATGGSFQVDLSASLEGNLDVQGIVYSGDPFPPINTAELYYFVDIWRGQNPASPDQPANLEYEDAASTEGHAKVTWNGSSLSYVVEGDLSADEFTPQSPGNSVMRFALHTQGTASFTAFRNDRIVVQAFIGVYASADVKTSDVSSANFANSDFSNTMGVEIQTHTPGYQLVMIDPRCTLDAVRNTNGSLQLTLTGPATGTYVLQASTNLVDWTPIITNANFTGKFDFTDTNAASFASRFYRSEKIQ